MALPAAPGQPSVPGSLPVVGQGGAPGAPPIGGAGGATMPTPNRGLQAAALAQVQQAVRLLEKSLSMLGVETEPGQAVMKALNGLSKHVPHGSTSPGVEQASLQKMMMEQRSDQPMLQLMRSMGGGAAGGGAPAAPQAA